MLCDKYLIAMVFIYFKRAMLDVEEYSEKNFFAALYLAHDMEEDNEYLKLKILAWLLSQNTIQTLSEFFKRRDNLWKLMKYRCLVSRKSCEEIMKIFPIHSIWERQRCESHAGAFRQY
ncbi:speedy protein A-like isoform X1 [Centruroides sculpturatus]|uniref:speedy protein A-like isoform X1 n=1 Tax=Centruroides sculpturatus TaxID=218467 RepID=UPI000C6D1966|nr:speedy protein A-like isoform X1 [Centruroides sculpturatus]